MRRLSFIKRSVCESKGWKAWPILQASSPKAVKYVTFVLANFSKVLGRVNSNRPRQPTTVTHFSCQVWTVPSYDQLKQVSMWKASSRPLTRVKHGGRPCSDRIRLFIHEVAAGGHLHQCYQRINQRPAWCWCEEETVQNSIAGKKI